jgi:hypothetical protein
MSFFSPLTPETQKFSYNVIVAVLLIGTATLAQLTGAWLPFALAALLCFAIIWQLYLRHLTPDPDAVSAEDKNRIAFHVQMTSNLARIEDFQRRQAPILQSQSQRIDELQAELKKLSEKKD